MTSATKKQIGNIGEEFACKYLKQNKYQILERNFYARHGEIDIIAKQKNEIIFIEVKTRTNTLYGNPIDAINVHKIKHIYETAKYYLYKTNQETKYIRFDVIEIFIRKNKVKIHHIKQII